jgi:hypothetical protein
MVRIHLLVESKMYPVPGGIKVIDDYGPVNVRSGDDLILGEHMMVEGDDEEIRAWLNPFNGIWVGCGAPMFQEFEVMHIR